MAKNLLEEALKNFNNVINCSKCSNNKVCGSDYQNFYNEVNKIREDGKLQFYSEGTNTDTFRIGGIEIKVFRSGALSILIRFKWMDSISIHKCLNLTRYPEDIEITSSECHLGALNMLAKEVTHSVFKKFKGDYFKEARSAISESYSSLKKKEFEEVLDNIDKNFNPHIYVGIFCSKIVRGNSQFSNKPVEPKYAQQSIIALANTTPEYTEEFFEPDMYIKDKNIARGKEIIILERRGWVIISDRLQEPTGGRRYRVGLIETFLYSLETILATTLSIETFNENLEEMIKSISYGFNIGVERFYAKGFLRTMGRIISASKWPWRGEVLENMREFISLLSKARSISPCEDITTSMEAHLKSMTAIRAVKDMKENLSLNELISLARERMKNYTHFLTTGHNIIVAETTRVQNLFLLILTGALVILTIVLQKEELVKLIALLF